MVKKVRVIGAGLAGCECAYQLAKRGILVDLYEMKAIKKTPAQKTDNYAELVCSNSLKSKEITNACGLLKEELLLLDSLVIKCANLSQIPSGTALAVDREKFSNMVTEKIKSNKNIHIIEEEFIDIDIKVPTIIATGPLTSDTLCKSLQKLYGEDFLSFFDACSPIIYTDSIDMNYAFFADRYNKGNADYLNIGLTKDEYIEFVNNLVCAKRATLKDFELKVFEGCMPIEVLAQRGVDALRFGPLKPIGITHPKTGEKYYAVIQLRKEDALGNAYNMVGFQTNLTISEQKRVFSVLPALKNADYARFGAMHKNIFLCSPKILNKFSQCKEYDNIFVAGQLSGVEGYVESVASGLACGINMYRHLANLEMIDFTNETILGSLLNYISFANIKDFQPMNANYSIMPPKYKDIKDKNKKRELLAHDALDKIKKIKEIYNV